MMRLNDRGDNVKALQTKLGIVADGIFGKDTENAVKRFQRDNGLAVDGIAGVATCAQLGLYTRSIKEIIVHCEATPEGEEFSRATLEASHKARKFSAYKINGRIEHIGYHYVIHLDGSIEACRPVEIAGCHCSGHNANSIGVSYVGGCPARSAKDWNLKAKDTRTPKQKESLLSLLKQLKAKYPIAEIHGHRDFANKACPSFDATKEYRGL